MRRNYKSAHCIGEKKEEEEEKHEREVWPKHHKSWDRIVKRITKSIESLREENETHLSSVGPKFLTWVKQTRNSRLQENLETEAEFDFACYLPPIDTCVKIYKITSIDVTLNQFICDFNVMLDWEDPSISLIEDNKSMRIGDHFQPKYEIYNAVLGEIEAFSGGSIPRLADGSWRVKWTMRYQATLSSPINPETYPFDMQNLKIELKSHTLSKAEIHHQFPGARVSKVSPQLIHPVRWRRRSGHALAANADWLAEFDFLGIQGFSVDDIYCVDVAVKRNPSNVMTNLVVSQAVTSAVSSLSFFIEAYHDAIGTVLTALLTAVAFKLVLLEWLPQSPKLSAIEIYMMISYGLFFFQALMITIIYLGSSNMLEEKCNYENEFISGKVTNKEPECETFTRLNLVFFTLNVILIVVQHLILFFMAVKRSQLQKWIQRSWTVLIGKRQTKKKMDEAALRPAGYDSRQLSCLYTIRSGSNEEGQPIACMQVIDKQNPDLLHDIRQFAVPLGSFGDFCPVHNGKNLNSTYPRTWLIGQKLEFTKAPDRSIKDQCARLDRTSGSYLLEKIGIADPGKPESKQWPQDKPGIQDNCFWWTNIKI